MLAEKKNPLSIDTIKENLKDYFSDKPVIRAYLFGSYARMEADENSDLDILIELDFSKPIGLFFFQMEYELKKRFNKKIDLVTTEEVSRYIKPYIEQDKLLVYQSA